MIGCEVGDFVGQKAKGARNRNAWAPPPIEGKVAAHTHGLRGEGIVKITTGRNSSVVAGVLR